MPSYSLEDPKNTLHSTSALPITKFFTPIYPPPFFIKIMNLHSPKIKIFSLYSIFLYNSNKKKKKNHKKNYKNMNNPLELLFTYFYERSILHSPQFSLYPLYQYSIRHNSLPLLQFISTRFDKNNELKENYEDLLFESYYYGREDIYSYLSREYKEIPLKYPYLYKRDISSILLSPKNPSTSSIAPSQ